MDFISQIDAAVFVPLILISATVFTVFWALDAATHARLVKIDITDKELTTHRIVLATSLLMVLSLLIMYWLPVAMLPVFIGCFITRTAHEFIDELHWHTDRCTPYESMLHLAMWLSILTNTSAMFLWGFFKQFAGVESLHPVYYIWAGILAVAIMIISTKEWNRA